jgi:hypothetical protein
LPVPLTVTPLTATGELPEIPAIALDVEVPEM